CGAEAMSTACVLPRLADKILSMTGTRSWPVSFVSKRAGATRVPRAGLGREGRHDIDSNWRKISSASPGHQARSRCHGWHIVLLALVHFRGVDSGRSPVAPDATVEAIALEENRRPNGGRFATAKTRLVRLPVSGPAGKTSSRDY